MPAPSRNYSLLLLALVALGLLLRLAFLAGGRPVWGDEAALALNVRGSWWSLFQPLDAAMQTSPEPVRVAQIGMPARQSAPLAYLALLKLVNDSSGGAVWPLRLPALGFSVILLLAAAWWARQHCAPLEGAALLALLALSGPLIEYSTEIKQYETEAATGALLMIVLLRRPEPESWSRRELGFVALAGAAAIWFAFGSVLLLFGTGLAWSVRAGCRRRWGDLPRLALVGSAWLASFGLCYALLLRHSFALHVAGYANSFPAWGRSLAGWLREALLELFMHTVGFDLRWCALALFLAVIGAVAGWKRNPLRVALLSAPILATILFAVAHVYPWSFQLLLFLAFNVACLLACGLAALSASLAAIAPPARVLPFLALAPACLASAWRPISAARARADFKYQTAIPLLASILHQSDTRRIVLNADDGLVARFEQERHALAFDQLQAGLHVIAWGNDTQLRQLPALADELAAFEAGQGCWLIGHAQNWDESRIELLRGLLAGRLVLAERRAASGAIALRFIRSPAESRPR